jgi:hypothetical protein
MKIVDTLPDYIKQLNSSKTNPGDFLTDMAGPSISHSKDGHWNVRNKIEQFIHEIIKRLFPKEDDSDLIAFENVLKQVEGINLHFRASEETKAKQTEFYKNVVEAAGRIIQLHANSDSDEIKDRCNSVALAVLTMRYRIEEENGGLRKLNPEEVDPAQVEAIKNLIERWKTWPSNKDWYEQTEPVDFTAQINEICQYPEIARFLLDPKNEKEADEYFHIAIKDNFDSDALNQYYYESKKLFENSLTGRTGAIARKLISVHLTPDEKAGDSKKTLNLLMENRWVNLLDKKQKVAFSNGLNWTIARIYKDFLGKFNPGELEIMWNGVTPYCGRAMGPRIVEEKSCWRKLKILKPFFKFLKLFFKKKHKYDSVDLSKPDWYKNTPVLDYRSKEYIEKRFNLTLEPGQWVLDLESTRRKTLDVNKAHGYNVIYEPIGNDTYRVHSLGPFPLSFPQNTCELVDFIGATEPASMDFDPNYFYAYRQKASFALAVEEKVAHAVIERIRLKRLNGYGFQFGWKNCAKVMSEIYEKEVKTPQFFRKKFLHLRVDGALATIQNVFNKTPEFLLKIIKVILALFFRAMRSLKVINDEGMEVYESLWKTPFFGDVPMINAPAAMHYRIKKHKILREYQIALQALVTQLKQENKSGTEIKSALEVEKANFRAKFEKDRYIEKGGEIKLYFNFEALELELKKENKSEEEIKNILENEKSKLRAKFDKDGYLEECEEVKLYKKEFANCVLNYGHTRDPWLKDRVPVAVTA